MKNKILITSLIIAYNAISQSIDYKITGNDITDNSKLKLRPSISFAIPPTDLVDKLPIMFNIEGQYWTKIMDFRATASIGTFKGGAIGATYHFVDKDKIRKEKFVVSRSRSGNTETTKYFKAPVTVHKISGPCLDLTSGVYKNAGFYSKLDFGWDFQTYARSYAEYGNSIIKGSMNGWVSIKTQGVLATTLVDMTDYFKLGAGTGKYTEERKVAIGGQISISGALKPWKDVTLYVSLPLGYMKYMGVSQAPETTNRGAPILGIVLGTQIRL